MIPDPPLAALLAEPCPLDDEDPPAFWAPVAVAVAPSPPPFTTVTGEFRCPMGHRWTGPETTVDTGWLAWAARARTNEGRTAA